VSALLVDTFWPLGLPTQRGLATLGYAIREDLYGGRVCLVAVDQAPGGDASQGHRLLSLATDARDHPLEARHRVVEHVLRLEEGHPDV
jgi:hypothetical protein